MSIRTSIKAYKKLGEVDKLIDKYDTNADIVLDLLEEYDYDIEKVDKILAEKQNKKIRVYL